MIRTAQPTRQPRSRADAERHRPTQPEHKLMGAVLTTAIDDLLDRRSAPEAEARRQLARAWIAGALAVVTFEAVCEALDLDAAAVRDAAARPRAPGP
jgi:hypothetical protein